MRKVAADRDNVVIEARREEAETAARLAAPKATDNDVVGGDVFNTVINDDDESRS